MNKLSHSLKSRRKSLANAFIILFLASLFFPIVAAIINQKGLPLPFMGGLDVFIAVLCLILFMILVSTVKHPIPLAVSDKTRTLTRYINSIPLLLIVLYFIGLKLNWEILLIGLGWRYWLILTAIPYLAETFDNAGNVSQEK